MLLRWEVMRCSGNPTLILTVKLRFDSYTTLLRSIASMAHSQSTAKSLIKENSPNFMRQSTTPSRKIETYWLTGSKISSKSNFKKLELRTQTHLLIQIGSDPSPDISLLMRLSMSFCQLTKMFRLVCSIKLRCLTYAWFLELPDQCL